MSTKRQDKRYVVSDVGYGYAIHDTHGRVQNRNTDPDKGIARSTNIRNAPIVDVCPTRERAFALAAEWNARERERPTG